MWIRDRFYSNIFIVKRPDQKGDFFMDRELLYVFGTGNAAVTNLYNTCFALRDSDEYFMVDAGGGNGILKIMDNMQVPVHRIHHIFVTHEHTDHILGIRCV